MRIVLIVGMLFLVAAGPATAPATKPAVDIAALEQQAKIAEDAVAAAKAACLVQLQGTTKYKTVVGDVDAKLAALEQARASDSPQDKLAASAAYNKAHKLADDAKAAALKADVAVARAVADSSLAQSALAQGRKVAEADAANKVKSAKATAERARYEKEHADFVALRGKMDDLKKRVAATVATGKRPDEYIDYVAKTSPAVEAEVIVLAYFHTETVNWSADEMQALFNDAKPIVDSWTKSLNSREQEYPSVDHISAAMADIERAVGRGSLASSMWKKFERDDKARVDDDELTSLAIEARQASDVFKQSIRFSDDAEGELDAVRRLLKSREGTRPVLPPPPPKDKSEAR